MKFTICIPTYNRAHTLERAIESVVHQSYKNFEILIIDDGSEDNTYEIVEKLKKKYEVGLFYYKQKNQGKHIALNKGIQKANGDFFIILDSDDMLDKNALKTFVEIWNSIPNKERREYCGIIGKCRDTKNNLIGKKFELDSLSYIEFHFIFGPYGDCCECIRTDILKNYTFPKIDNVKFVPEAFVFDQIGLNYKLKTTNKILKIVEYMNDGITLNKNIFFKKNSLGYLYYYAIIINKVFQNKKYKIPLKRKCLVILKYWKGLSYCNSISNVPKVKLPIYGYLLKYFTFLIGRRD